MRSWLASALWLVVPALAAATAHSAPVKSTKPAPAHAAPHAGASTGPRTLTLPNGLRVVIVPDSSAATVDVSLWFPAGSRAERPGRTGLTQVVNGLLFAGSRRFPPGEHQRLIEREGGTTKVFSLADFASVSETVPPASLELALRLEADRMGSASLSAAAFEATRATIMRSSRDPSAHTSIALGMRKLYQTAFAGHSYRWPAGGLESDVPKLTLDDVRAWWRDRYGPDGAWLVLSGRLDPDSAAALARRTLGSVAKRGQPRPAVPAPAAQTAPRRGSGTLEGPGRVLLVGWRTPAARSADAAAMTVLDAMLTHRRPSRIENALMADTSNFLAVQAGFDQRRDAGLLFVAALISPLADSVAAERAVTAAVEKLGTSAPAAEDFASAVRQLEVETLFGWQTPAGMGDAIGRSAMLTGSADAAASLEAAKRLTPEALQQAAARQLTPAHRTVVWMLAPERSGAVPGAAPASPAGTPKGAR